MKKRRSFKLQTHYWLMVVPGLLWLLFFNLVPLSGIIIAFENYVPGLGPWRSEFNGLENFEYLFSMADAKRVIVNTIVIACSKVVLNLLVPLIFALLLNEVKNLRYKKFIQTAVYLPHFLSWVILASVILNIFGLDGIVNKIGGLFGAEPVIWFSESSYFRQLVIGTDVWKEFGFNAVIFLAALTGIDPNLYEAASIDGCGKFRSVFYITLPGIMPTIVLVGVLGLSNVLNAGFDQVFNLYGPAVYETGDIIDTMVYRMGLEQAKFGPSTAVGLLKSVVSFILISSAYLIAYKKFDYKVF